MNSSTQNDELLIAFLDEAIYSLEDLPAMIGQLTEASGDPNIVNAVFRAVHSIKGNAGFFGIADVKQFSHALENALNELREDRVAPTEELCRCLIDGCDLLGEMLQTLQNGGETDGLRGRGEEILAQLDSQLTAAKSGASPDYVRELAQIAEEIAASDAAQAAEWSRRILELLPKPATGEEPGADDTADMDFVAQAQYWQDRHFTCGAEDVTTVVNSICMAFANVRETSFAKTPFEPVDTWFNELISTAETADRAADAGDIQSARDNLALIMGSPLDLDESLLQMVWDSFRTAIANWKEETSDTAPAPTPDTTATSEASGSDGESAPAQASKSRFVRVREEYLDEFVGDVSKLFITCERLKDLHVRMAEERMLEPLVDEFKQINAAFYKQTDALQTSVASLRTLPARTLLNKFPRMARTLAANLGKQLEVTLAGEEMGIDKTLIEDLDSPMNHIVRNVCDHAIESPEEREASGKPSQGNLTIRCELSKTHVILTIADDGRGIDPNRMRAKAVERELLTEDQARSLSDQDAVELIFHPGFSTAESVTEVSGRGVGMDVVRTAIQDHQGDVAVESRVGKGTTFRITIPIRKAVLVIDGLIVREDETDYVVPLEFIREIVEVAPEQITTVQGSRMMMVRNCPLSVVHLQQVTAQNEPPSQVERGFGLVLHTKEGELCMLTEKVLGIRKIVINAMPEVLPDISCLAGVAQLGNGRLALALSAADVVRSTMSTANDRPLIAK